MASAPAGWSINGTAVYNASAASVELTAPGVTFQAGTLIYKRSFTPDVFDIRFDFRIGFQGGTRSDGMGLMLIKDGPTAVGHNGSGLGMAGLNGFGVELDIFNNGQCGDSSGNHVGVDELTFCNAGQGTPTAIASADVAGIDLGDAQWHSAEIALSGGAISVDIDGGRRLTNVSLPGLDVASSYFIGFAGATGGLVDSTGAGGYRHDIRNIAITFPAPRCL